MFHSCKLTKKCQNYDRNNSICNRCESRPSDKRDLGGYVPEPSVGEDYQYHMRVLEDHMNASYFNNEDNVQTYDPILEEERDRQYRESVRELQDFMVQNDVKIEVEDA